MLWRTGCGCSDAVLGGPGTAKAGGGMSTPADWRRQLAPGARLRRLPLAVFGTGEWASVAWCPRMVTAYLCRTQTQATAAKDDMDERACGGACIGDHTVEHFTGSLPG